MLSCTAADVVEKLLSLYRADGGIASSSALKEQCGGRLCLHALFAGGWEAEMVTACMHLLMEVAELQTFLVQQQQHEQEGHNSMDTSNGGPPAVSVPVTNLQVLGLEHVQLLLK